ncbi:hypothetical protein C7271_18925 [filamentous cyanobacterium CCP5]|nr:hypothetical protein C7271_18925 [filamentous cyanobacterium CCP5]
MGLSEEIKAVYERALRLREQAVDSVMQPDLLSEALQELYFVLEELHTADEEIRHQNQKLISTRQQTELERHRYWMLFELAPDGYLVTDERGNILHANQAAEALFSVHHKALIGKPLLVLIEARDRSELLRRLAHREPIKNWQITLKPLQANEILVEIATAYLQDPQTKSVTILWSLRDMTQRSP